VQQLYEKHDTLSIYYWMENWITPGMKPHDECVLDYSKALVGATTRAFANRMTLEEFSKSCFLRLINRETNVPPCLIHIDVAHINYML